MAKVKKFPLTTVDLIARLEYLNDAINLDQDVLVRLGMRAERESLKRRLAELETKQ